MDNSNPCYAHLSVSQDTKMALIHLGPIKISSSSKQSHSSQSKLSVSLRML